jgi:superfamily II DNA or RNA helicase
MTSFLGSLKVRLADRFSISPNEELDDFDVVPFSGESLLRNGIGPGAVSEADSNLSKDLQDEFQLKLFQLGAASAYHLGDNNYLVVDPSAQPVLAELARLQKAEQPEIKAFIRNPKAFVSIAVARSLEANGDFADLNEAEQEERLEQAVGPAWLETREFAERVQGIGVFIYAAKPMQSSGTTWLPETFPETVREALEKMPDGELSALEQTIERGLNQPGTTVRIAGVTLPVDSSLDAVVKAERDKRNEGTDGSDTLQGGGDKNSQPVILLPASNFDNVKWREGIRPRQPQASRTVPDTIRTPLKPHQMDSFAWAVEAWKSGLPGVLNADEQGLGKTLQTITFLNWLQDHMRNAAASERGPILVVAPTSLLVNWEQEVERHVEQGGFGHLTRLYGTSIAAAKKTGAHGVDTQSGLPLLDLQWLEEAISEGRAHRHWILTTYTTLTNYQHSLGRIRFAAAVFDEVQAIKNQDTIRSKAVASLKADFRIGLTGTPIENSTLDLWSIMDVLAPGVLGSGKEFQDRYREPTEANMTELYIRVFKPVGGTPALALRRTKEEVARDLPSKTRRIHPRLMPELQAAAYDQARGKLSTGRPGSALKMLHHIRSVSVHPDPESQDFIANSARVRAVLDILDGIKAANERALVFIEHREVQFRFAEIIRHRYRLEKIEIINGDTPIKRRQAIVNRFQLHLEQDRGFDILVLGPKAAGTGLTLTAATHVIHLSRWWNPAVEEQCNDRIHRIGQTRPVTVHVPMAVHDRFRGYSFDCLLHSLMQRKRRMARQALWPMGDTEGDAGELQSMLKHKAKDTRADAVMSAMAVMFARDGIPLPQTDVDGSLTCS